MVNRSALLEMTMASTYIVSLALQAIFHLDTAQSGILLTATMISSILTAFLVQKIQKLFPLAWTIKTSLCILFLGNLGMGSAGYYNNIYLLVFSRLMIGSSASLLFSLAMIVIMDKTPISQQSIVSSLVYKFRELSGTFCVVLMHAIISFTRQNICILTGNRFAISMLLPIVSTFIVLLICYKKLP